MSDPMILQFSEAALVVLKEAGEPLHFREITERVLEKGLVASKGKTPHDTMRVQLSRLVTSALEAEEAPQVQSLGNGLWCLAPGANDSQPAAKTQQHGDDETEPKAKATTDRERRAMLWSLLESGAEALGKEVRFRVYWAGERDVSVEVTPLDQQLRVRVTQDMIDVADAIDEDYLAGLSSAKSGRRFMERSLDDLRANLGKTVTLNTYAVPVLIPRFLPKYTTVTLSVYRRFYIDPAELGEFLGDKLLAKLTKAQAEPGQLLRFAMAVNILFGDGGADGDPPPAGDTDVPKTAEQETRPWANNRNVIFFGPPGTGKSFFLASVVRKHLAAPEDHVFRVTFHPEYSYYDFVGSYRPAVGWLKTATSFIGADDKERSEEPRTYYHFDPGPLSQAIQLAANSPDKPTVLIIEEINRGNCAAIFGDVFQLLDRILDKTRAKQRGLLVGTSEYAIRPSAEWAGWLRRELSAENSAFSRDRGALRLPPNLYLYATMNTSDQSLFPMDTAFRRRWGMEFVGIGRSTDERVRVPLHADDEKGVPWLRLMRQLNTQIVRHTRTDDKQMGPYFVRPTSVGAMVGADDFCAKVIFYLWSDVFRDQPSAVFNAKLTTYEEVVAAFKEGKHVFQPDLLERVGIKKVQGDGESADSPPSD